MPNSIVRPTPTTVLDLAVDAEPHDDPVQRDRDDDRLEHQRDGRRNVEVRRILNEGLPGDRQRQHQRVQREDVQQRVEAVLIELHEAHQHQPAGKHVSDIEDETAHLQAPRHEQQERGQEAEHQRGAEELRHAEYPHLGDGGLEQREQEATNREFGEIGGDADRERRRARAAGAMPQGTNTQPMSDK